MQTKIAERHSAGGFWISHLVLLEVAWALGSAKYRRDRTAIANQLDLLLNHPEVTFQQLDVVKAALATFRQHRGVTFADCFILETARKAAQVPLATFDQGLASISDVEELT